MHSLPELTLPPVRFYQKQDGGQLKVFDIVRKKYVALTPEEWVRQHMIHFLINYKSVPVSLMVIEKTFKLERLQKRFDIAVYSRQGEPVLLVECKAPEVPLNQRVVDQALRYNMKLHVKYLLITNGMKHAGYYADYQHNKLEVLNELPVYEHLIGDSPSGYNINKS